MMGVKEAHSRLLKQSHSFFQCLALDFYRKAYMDITVLLDGVYNILLLLTTTCTVELPNYSDLQQNGRGRNSGRIPRAWQHCHGNCNLDTLLTHINITQLYND